jgi:hypothetical protein
MRGNEKGHMSVLLLNVDLYGMPLFKCKRINFYENSDVFITAAIMEVFN